MPAIAHGRLYVSELNVISQRNLNALPQIKAFSDSLAAALGMPKSEPTKVEFGGEASETWFKFERKANTPYSQNKYWSLASVSTTVHVRLLNELESLLTA